MKRMSKPDKSWILDNPDYIDLLDQIIEYEKNLDPEEDDRVLQRFNEKEGTDYDVKWRNTDVPVHPNRLYQLEVNGFLDRVFDSNSSTMYSVRNRDEMEELVKEINGKFDEGMRTAIHDFPSEEELEDMGIFDDVVGYDRIKWLLRRAMSAEDIVNILLVGPPGSAKTVFLMCINKLENSVFTSGSPTTGPGVFDLMFDEEPRYVAIDELDNMDPEHQQAFADYTETGILVETKGNNKRRSMRTNAKTFAAANDTSDILDDIQNRFTDLHFEPYTFNEFIEVCEHILTRNEDKTEEEAKKIAEAVWDFEGFGNVRKAIQAARLSRGDPEKVIEVLEDYSASEGLI